MRSSLSILALLTLASSSALATPKDLAGKDPHASPQNLSVSKSACAEGQADSNTICPMEVMVLTNDASQYRFIVATKTACGGQPKPEDFGTDRGYRISAVRAIGTCSAEGKPDTRVVGIRFDTSLHEAKLNPTGRDGNVFAAWRDDAKGFN